MYKHLDYVLHTNPQIIEVIFKDNSDEAVAEYADALLEQGMTFLEQKRTTPIYLLIDVTQSGLYSLHTAVSHISRNTTMLAELPCAYFAYLTDSPSERVLIEQFVYFQNTRSKDSRMVFGSCERQQAIDWLLANNEA